MLSFGTGIRIDVFKKFDVCIDVRYFGVVSRTHGCILVYIWRTLVIMLLVSYFGKFEQKLCWA